MPVFLICTRSIVFFKIGNKYKLSYIGFTPGHKIFTHQKNFLYKIPRVRRTYECLADYCYWVNLRVHFG